MTVNVVTTIIIKRPRAEVAAYGADPDNAPRWYTNISSVEWHTPRPLRIGSRLGFVAQFLRRRLEYTYEIAEFIPGERLVMRTAEGPFPMETTYTWEDAGPDQTRMTLRNRGVPRGFTRLLALVMEPAIAHANRKDLTRLKHILERPN